MEVSVVSVSSSLVMMCTSAPYRISQKFKVSFIVNSATCTVHTQGRRKGGEVRTILRAHDGRGPPEGET